MDSERTVIPWSRDHSDIHEEFILDYCDYVNGGELPAKANQDMKYVLELQKDRLEKFDIQQHIEAESIDTGEFAWCSDKDWQDGVYEGIRRMMPCWVRRTFYHGDKKLHDDKGNKFLYQTMLDAKDPARAQDHTFTCPNCGNVSTVGQLQEGCPYCGTHFKHTDLFPRISNFFFLYNESFGSENVSWAKGTASFFLRNKPINTNTIPLQVLKFYPLALLLFAAIAFFQGNIEFSTMTVFCALVGSLVVAYLLFVVYLLVLTFYKSGKSVWLMMTSAGSKRRFQSEMSRLDPNFSYDYFSGMVVLLLEMLVYSDSPQEIPIFEGTYIPEEFSNIVQLDYCDAIALRNFRTQGDTCYADVEVYADTLHWNGKSLHKERDVFSMTLFRDVNLPLDIDYSPLKVHCNSCGASFDAVREKCCPYCSTPYENDHRDWTVASVSMRKNNPLTTLLGIIVLLVAIPVVLFALTVVFHLMPALLFLLVIFVAARAKPVRRER